MNTINEYIKGTISQSANKQIWTVITGGPGVGKTSLITALVAQGQAVVHEAATDVIKAELEKGVEEPWIKEGFREKIIALQEERQRQACARNVQQLYFDRCPIDTMTYCLHFKSEPTDELKNAVQKIIDESLYDRTVFLLENLGFCNQDSVRCEDQHESLIIQEEVYDNYKRLGFQVIRIPAATVEERTKMILAFQLKK